MSQHPVSRSPGLVDRLGKVVGSLVTMLVLLMTALGAWNAIGRTFGREFGMRLTSNALVEAQWYLFALVFVLGAGWGLACDAHVRVDVLAAGFTPRTRRLVDVVGHTLLLVPFVVLSLWLCWPFARNAWVVREVSPDPGGLPRWPLKVAILLGFCLLLLHGVAEISRRLGRSGRDRDLASGP